MENPKFELILIVKSNYSQTKSHKFEIYHILQIFKLVIKICYLFETSVIHFFFQSLIYKDFEVPKVHGNLTL